ncbi:MAG TPA: hypothetical protein VFV52_17120 [Bacilli bacterium]|nr:hypothetical protein [Bacilli bacterium]
MALQFAIFRNKSFLLLWLSGLISGLGDAMFTLALSWMVVETTHSGAVLGQPLPSSCRRFGRTRDRLLFKCKKRLH